MRFPYSYKKVHATLTKTKGPAKDHLCSCGDQAAEWAYQFTAGDKELRNPDGSRPHSTNPDDYKAMCRGCHLNFDMANDPEFAGKVRGGGGSEESRAAIIRKWETDREWVAKMKTVLTQNSKTIAERRKVEPELAERFIQAGRKAGARRKERMKNDPEFAKQMRETLTANSKVRCRCDECGFESNRAGIGNHHRFSGHTGRTVLEYVNEESTEEKP